MFGFGVIVSKQYFFNRSISTEKQVERRVMPLVRSIHRLVSRYSISINDTLKWINTWKWRCMLDGANRCTIKVPVQYRPISVPMICDVCASYGSVLSKAVDLIIPGGREFSSRMPGWIFPSARRQSTKETLSWVEIQIHRVLLTRRHVPFDESSTVHSWSIALAWVSLLVRQWRRRTTVIPLQRRNICPVTLRRIDHSFSVPFLALNWFPKASFHDADICTMYTHILLILPTSTAYRIVKRLVQTRPTIGNILKQNPFSEFSVRWCDFLLFFCRRCRLLADRSLYFHNIRFGCWNTIEKQKRFIYMWWGELEIQISTSPTTHGHESFADPRWASKRTESRRAALAMLCSVFLAGI